MNSEKMSSSVDTDETVIVQILNKNQRCHQGKVVK